MMPSKMFTVFTKTCHCTVLKTVQINNCLRLAVNIQNVRQLYSKITLGIDSFMHQCEITQKQMGSIADKFKSKMADFEEEDGKSMVFTEDLKNMIHLTTDEKDIELVVKMLKKFNKQNKELRFGRFIFGPVVMRLFHHYNKPELALEIFKSDEFVGLFDQIITYQILLDLLFETKKYQEILDCVGLIKEKQLEGFMYPRNVVVLSMAACYKLNSQESLDYALKLWQELKEVGHYPMRRATTFCAGLAYNQGNPEIALEILASAKNQHYTTVRNLKIACLASVGRVENVVPILKNVLSDDIPGNRKHTFNRDILDKVKEAVTLLDNPEIVLEFDRIEQILQKQGHLSDEPIDEQLCQEIQPSAAFMNKRSNLQQRYKQYQNEPQSYTKKKYVTFQQRPGLDELV